MKIPPSLAPVRSGPVPALSGKTDATTTNGNSARAPTGGAPTELFVAGTQLTGEDPWDRTLPACMRFPDPGGMQLACPINRETWCTQDACGPRRQQLMDHARIFIGDTKNYEMLY